MIWGPSYLQESSNYNLSVVDEKQQIMGRCLMIYLLNKKGVFYVKKKGFFIKIMLLSTLHQ